MKKQLLILITGILFISFLGCNKDKDKLNYIEKTLPGNWKVDSYAIPKYGYGFRYKGRIIYKDTTIHNLGTIQFPEFSTDSLALSTMETIGVQLNYKIDNENYTFSMERLFLSGEDYFVYFRLPLNFKSDTTSETSMFIETSRFFNFNSYLYIEDENNILIKEASGDHKRVIRLVRS